MGSTLRVDVPAVTKTQGEPEGQTNAKVIVIHVKEMSFVGSDEKLQFRMRAQSGVLSMTILRVNQDCRMREVARYGDELLRPHRHCKSGPRASTAFSRTSRRARTSVTSSLRAVAEAFGPLEIASE